MSKYVLAQVDGDYSNSHEIFTDDVIFNGLLFKVAGRADVTEGFVGFVNGPLDSIRIEAIVEAGAPNRFMVLHWVRFKVNPEREHVVCDLVSLRDGLIERVDNVFDTNAMPQVVKDMGAQCSAGSAKAQAEDRAGLAGHA